MNVVLSYDFLPQVGGAHLWLYEVYRRWPDEVRLLTARYAADIEEARRQIEFDEQDHGPLRVSRTAVVREINLLDPRSCAGFVSQAFTIRRLSEGLPDTNVHALRAFPEGFAGLLYRLTHRRYSRLITYAHGEEVLIAQQSRQQKAMAKAVYAQSDLIIANSANTEQLVRALCASANVVRIHPGVPLADFNRSPAEVDEYRRKLGWPEQTVLVCTVARMEPRKNQSVVVRAVGQLRQQGLPVAYLCAGDGEERSRLEAMAATMGLQQWVRFTGTVSEREKELIYGASQIHAMPSIQIGGMIEGFGIVFLEAAAAGIPSISGKIGGQPEAVLDGKTGFVVDGTNLSEVARALEKLVCDSELRARMGQEGRKWAASHDWAGVVRRIDAEVTRLRAND